jgi:hypothetical protein
MQRLSRPVVAGDQGGETAQRDAREVQDQRDHIDRQGQRLAQSEEKSLILPRRFPSTIYWEAIRPFIPSFDLSC